MFDYLVSANKLASNSVLSLGTLFLKNYNYVVLSVTDSFQRHTRRPSDDSKIFVMLLLFVPPPNRFMILMAEQSEGKTHGP